MHRGAGRGTWLSVKGSAVMTKDSNTIDDEVDDLGKQVAGDDWGDRYQSQLDIGHLEVELCWLSSYRDSFDGRIYVTGGGCG